MLEALSRLEWGRQCVASAMASLRLADAASRARHHAGTFTADPAGWFHQEAKAHKVRCMAVEIEARVAKYADWPFGEWCVRFGGDDQSACMAGYLSALGASALWAVANDSARTSGSGDAFWHWLRAESRWQESTWHLYAAMMEGLV